MTEEHLASDDLEWYVAEGLAMAERGWSSDRLDPIEDHVAICERCAEALSAAARLEVLCIETASPAPRSSSSRPFLAALALAAAALLLAQVGLGRASSDVTATTSAPTVSLDAGLELALDSSMAGDFEP